MKIKIELNKQNQTAIYLATNQSIHINPQATKNDPVIDLDSLKIAELSQYQRYISIKNLQDGLNEIELKERKHPTLSTRIQYTPEEEARIAELQAEIDAIKAEASKRQPFKLLTLEQVNKLNETEKLEYAEKLKEYYGL